MPGDRERAPAEDTAEDTLTVLRDIWSASGQESADREKRLGGRGGKVCKNMARIGFGGMADGATGDTNTPVDEDVRSGWRARLERDGKLDPRAESIGQMLRRR